MFNLVVLAPTKALTTFCNLENNANAVSLIIHNNIL